jgi:hypothetical protein
MIEQNQNKSVFKNWKLFRRIKLEDITPELPGTTIKQSFIICTNRTAATPPWLLLTGRRDL